MAARFTRRAHFVSTLPKVGQIRHTRHTRRVIGAPSWQRHATRGITMNRDWMKFIAALNRNLAYPSDDVMWSLLDCGWLKPL